jgi:zinc transport system permease protein
MLPNADIVESLFGAFPVLSLPFLLVILFAAAILTVLCFVLTKGFLFRIVSPDLAKVHGLGRKYDLALLLVFALIVALGIKLVGTLLMGALTIIPASIAKDLSRSMRWNVILSSALGGAISVAGIWIADTFRFLPGPSIVLLGAGLFVLILPIARKGTA